MKKLKSLSVFFPSLNDAKILPYLLSKIYRVLPKISDDFEVIVINDGSTDDTKGVITGLKGFFPHLKLVDHEKNRGFGGALRSGFHHATKDWVFYTDGDGQYEPMEIVKLVESVSGKIDVVNGYRRQRGDAALRTVLGKIYNGLLHQFYRLPIRDIDCDMRLIRGSLLKNIPLKFSSSIVSLELILRLRDKGARFKEVEVSHFPRTFGRSEFFKIRHLANTIKDSIRFYQTYP